MDKKRNCMRKSTGIALAALLVIAAAGIMPAAASELTDYNGINITPANSIRFDKYGDGTYYIGFQTPSGGLNATHISSWSSDMYGQITDITDTEGTFYITDVGNRSFQDDIILLIAVNSSNYSNFELELTCSGYTWTPTGTGKAPFYDPTEVVHSETLSEGEFDEDDFIQVSSTDVLQNWKPGPSAIIPIFESGDSDLYKIFFVDTYAGIFGNVSDISTLTDNGSVKIEYDISASPGSTVVFNAYSWNQQTWDWKRDQFKYDVPGIRWTNNINTTKTNENVWRVTVPAKK